MRAAARRDDADTELAGHLNGLFHGFGRDHEAEGVLAIERATIGVTRSTFKFGRGLVSPRRTRSR
jgi:hypothetical protein